MNRVASAVAGLAVLVIVLVVAGCGAGQNTQTDSMEPSVNGAIAQVGPIAIRDAQFAVASRGVFPAGSNVELRLTIVNTGTADDELVEVSSPLADDVEITGDRALVAGRAVQIGGGGGSNTSSSSLPPSSRPTTSTPPGSGTTRPTSPTFPTSSPAPQPVELGKASIVLKGLNAPLYAGKTYAVTFVFRKAGSVTVQLPIANPPTPRPEPTGESHG